MKEIQGQTLLWLSSATSALDFSDTRGAPFRAKAFGKI